MIAGRHGEKYQYANTYHPKKITGFDNIRALTCSINKKYGIRKAIK